MGNENNLKPFKKGESGNPKGRPKDSEEIKDFRKWAKLTCSEPDFFERLEKRMWKSDKILQLVVLYGVGKPPEAGDEPQVKITPLTVSQVDIDNLNKLTRLERKAYLSAMKKMNGDNETKDE